MSINQFSRTEILIGQEAQKRLCEARVIIFGIGGVGSFVAEALARVGIFHIDLVDNDTVSLTNINRQLIALHSTVGKYKTDVMKDRILDINPNCEVNSIKSFLSRENLYEFDLTKYTYIIDAIDTVASKILLAEFAYNNSISIISCMGAGNKLETEFEICDIFKTSVCPLARVMRSELKKRGIERLKVVYSTEKAIKPQQSEEEAQKRQIPGSMSYVPSCAGLTLAGEVIRDIAKL